MGEKIYMRDNSIQYLGYYLIEYEAYDYVFHKFDKAMAFCWEHSLDPNKVIQTNSPEILRRCKELSLMRLGELDHTKAALQALFEKACEDSHRLGEKIDRCEDILSKERNIGAQVDLEMAKEACTKQGGVVHGIYLSMQAVDAQREAYWDVVYRVTKWEKG